MISSHVQAERIRNIFFSVSDFSPKTLILILSSVDFSLIIFTNIGTRYFLECSNNYISKTECVLRWLISLLTVNLVRDDEDKKTFKRKMVVWLSYKTLEELNQTPLGTKHSVSILKEELAKPACPVSFKGVSFLPVNCWQKMIEAPFVAYRGVVSLDCVKHLFRQRHIQARLL